MSFIDKRLYRGKVTRQELVEGRDGHPQLNLYARLEGMLVDGRRPEAGLTPCPEVEIQVALRFPTDNPDAMGYSIKDLEKLGFVEEDLGRLSPAAGKKHVSFVGRDVYVMPSTKTYNDFPQTFWNLRFPSAVEQKPVDPAKLTKSKAGDAYREALRRHKEQAAASPTSDDTPF